eukprot:TRINITY_DN250_c1_g1_i2.p1 TRINITY_DN250_c1_g1~~TRINITY_DN250_c1_g1_i2.p1  ORF type:complete len:1031 (+),score=352.39 TRINITY_DN250_c1_g1_i2:158-3250(+)
MAAASVLSYDGLTTSSGFLSLLDEDEVQLKEHALTFLNQSVDVFWPEIAEKVEILEELYEDSDFPASSRKLAALVASKVFYHLGRFNESMMLALGADELFSLSDEGEYVSTIVSKSIDEFARIRKQNAIKISDARTRALVTSSNFDEKDVETEAEDPRLVALVERMFEQCFEQEQFTQACGMAIESLRLDIVEKSIVSSGDVKSMLQYMFDISMDIIINRDWRTQLLNLLVRLYRESSVPDYVNMSRSLVFLDRPEEIVEIFKSLLATNSLDDNLLAFQIAFELVDNSTQKFRGQVIAGLPQVEEKEEEQKKEGEKEGEEKEGDVKEEKKETTADEYLQTLHKILSGQPTLEFFLQFLYSKNKADMKILEKMQSLFEPRRSVLHQGLVVSNAIMHCGTKNDSFLAKNLKWSARATNWAKFTTTASLGVIHKGHLSEAMNVLDPYLPKPGIDASPYTEGGSLFGLGLIHANQGANTVTHYILQCLRNVDDSSLGGGGNTRPGALDEAQEREIVQHGAALGLGVAALASESAEAFDELLNLLYHHDSAVAGEAAGLSLGLVMLGSATERAAEMLNFAHVTQHEKIIRSVGLGLALIFYGLEEKADAMIETLTMDKDPILRYGAMFTVGLAYCGTANNKAVRKLLHVAVSDVSDDVRRAAVMNLGFVMFRRPEQVPRLVSLLSESYNPHVRYGAALALGIACAGSGSKEAVELLLTLCKDGTHFVRQGAYIALAMVLIEIAEEANPAVAEFRQKLLDVIGDKHQPHPAKFGAILALGILDAGGRNCTIALSSRSGHLNLCGVVGLVVFLQYWYWYPFQLFLSLAFSPTAILGVNSNLEMPSYIMKSNARPSLFAYPSPTKEEEEEEVQTVVKAELSVTKKAKLRQSRLVSKKAGDAMDVDEDAEPAASTSDKMDVDAKEIPGEGDEKKEEEAEKKESDGEKKEEKKEEEKKEPEPEFELLNNPARVTRTQLKHISFDVDSRYVPISEGVHGIVVLKDTTPDLNEEIITPAVPVSNSGEDVEEAPAPPSFTYLG